MELNKAISLRLSELLTERNMSMYKLYTKTGLAKSTISHIISCSHVSMTMKTLHIICQGLDIELVEFFDSPLFLNENLEP